MELGRNPAYRERIARRVLNRIRFIQKITQTKQMSIKGLWRGGTGPGIQAKALRDATWNTLTLLLAEQGGEMGHYNAVSSGINSRLGARP